jgi:outer membrane receptor protein involved in Fe transport
MVRRFAAGAQEANREGSMATEPRIGWARSAAVWFGAGVLLLATATAWAEPPKDSDYLVLELPLPVMQAPQGGGPPTPATAPQPQSGGAQNQSSPTTQQPGQSGQTPSVLDLPLEQLSNVEVRPQQPAAGGGSAARATPTTTGSILSPAASELPTPVSIGELLEQSPSVSVRRTSSLNLDPRVRGFTSSQINANANGMTQLKTRIDIDSLFSQIDPGIVDNLTIIDGPYTSLYGPGFAFLSADLLPAPRYSNGPQFHGSTIFSTNTNGGQIYNRERLWGGGSDWGFTLSYGLRTGAEYEPGGGSPDFDVPASYRQQDVFLALSADLTAHSRLEFDYIRQDLFNVELPGVAYDIRRSQTDQFNVRFVAQDDPKGPENLVLQFWSERTPYDGNNFSYSKRVTFSNVLIGEPFPQLLGGALISNGLSESLGARALLTLGAKDCLQWTFGGDYRQYSQFYHEQDFQGDGTPAFGGGIFGIPHARQEDAGVFTNLVAPVRKNVTLTMGGRLDRVTDAVDANDPVAIPANTYTPGFAEPSELMGMAYLNSEVKAADWLKLSGGVAFAMRSPNLAELYSDEPFVPVNRFGNSFTDGTSVLRPEENLQFDLGASAKWDRLTLGARGFESTIYDYILPVPSTVSVAVPAGVPAPMNLHRDIINFLPNPADPTINPLADAAALDYRYLNLNRVTLFGGELSGEFRLLPWLALNGTLAYVRGTIHSPVRFIEATHTIVPLPGTEPLPGIYPLNSTVGLRVFEPRKNKWSMELVARFVDDQDRVATRYAELPTPGFGVWYVRGNYQVGEHLRLFSSIDNLFDRVYWEHGSLAIVNPQGTIDFVKEPGISWIFGFEAKF